jgi:hypothetical protein
MATLGDRDTRAARPSSGTRKGIERLLMSVLALICLADVADARITIRRHSPYDNFFFHGDYYGEPFDPSGAFSLELWNCADGAMPTFIADREPLIVCDYNAEAGFTLGNLVYSIEVSAGSCIDHGRSCYYRNRDVSSRTAGIRYFRVQYPRALRGNLVWLDSYGDLSSANQANMLILIEINGNPTAIRNDTFRPLNDGGWSSR